MSSKVEFLTICLVSAFQAFTGKKGEAFFAFQIGEQIHQVIPGLRQPLLASEVFCVAGFSKWLQCLFDRITVRRGRREELFLEGI